MAYSDFVEVDTGLYVGAHPEGVIDPFELGADVVVTLTREPSTVAVPQDKLLLHWPIADGPIPPLSVLHGVAATISKLLDHGAVVFIHCHAGMNRSCLVAGLVLIYRGMAGDEAVLRIRGRREGSLSPDYADWLRSEEPAPSRPHVM
jgi:protein-tyrosine phosphatase